MIITIVGLIIDWAILLLNDQTLLSFHSIYMAILVIKLWRHQQPEHYTIRETGKNELETVTKDEGEIK
jgi:hypothetical protein